MSTRWLDINNCDSKCPNYCSRMVAREIKMHLFAATPPLASLRLRCWMCASNQDRKEPFRIMSVDGRRVCFYEKTTRLV